MPGSEWSKLVAEPTAKELDAALADVRVRAVPIARRQARNARALSVLVAVLVIGGAFAGGRAYANGGVRIGEDVSMPGHWKGQPELVAAGDAAHPAYVLPATGPTVQRFHITSWTEWDGERFGEGEVWLEGPPSVTFTIGAWYLEDRFNGYFHIVSTATTSIYQGRSNVTRAFGASPRGLPLTEEGSANFWLRTARGQPVLLYPFGRGGLGEPTTVVRIEGPDVPAPATAVRWAGLHSNFFEWNRPAFGSSIDASEVERMRAAGVRTAVVRSGGLSVTPLRIAEATVIRLSVVGHNDTTEAVIGGDGQQFEVAGIPGPLRAWQSRQRDARAICIHVFRADQEAAEADHRAGREPLRAEGCIPEASRWTPFETLTSQGQRLRIQLVQVPGVNY